MSLLQCFFKHQLHLTDEMYHRFIDLSETQHLKKKDLFAQRGKICQYLGIIESGLLCSTIEKGTEEFIKDFYFSDSLILAYGSFLTGEPCIGNI